MTYFARGKITLYAYLDLYVYPKIFLQNTNESLTTKITSEKFWRGDMNKVIGDLKEEKFILIEKLGKQDKAFWEEIRKKKEEVDVRLIFILCYRLNRNLKSNY